MNNLKLLLILNIIYASAIQVYGQLNSNFKTCTALQSSTLDIQCQRGFRKVSCDNRMLPGTKANLACKSGYQLDKAPEFTRVTCGDDGIWDNCLFNCVPECGNPTPVETVFPSNPPTTYLAGQYPWFAMVYVEDEFFQKFSGGYRFTCGATIINHKMVLTTAYCVFKPQIKLEEYRIAVGSSIFRYRNKTEDIYAQHLEVEKMVFPKGYEFDSESKPNNIAIVVIKGSIIFNQIVKPICMDRAFVGPVEELSFGTEGYLPGFSTDRQTGDTIRYVYNVTLPYISNSSCRNFEYAFKRYYQSYDKFCVGNLTFGYEIPFGFLGSGYFLPEYKDFDVAYYLRGVASSYGRTLNFIGITDLMVHIPWIVQQENIYLKADLEEPPEFCGETSRSNITAVEHVQGSCRLPSMPRNGRYFVGGLSSEPVPGSSIQEWSVLKFKCDKGYSLRGSDTSFCNEGAWSSTPQCQRMCKSLIVLSLEIYCSLKNQEVPCENPMAPGTTADLSCKKGYTLYYSPDNTRLTCEDDGTWDSSPFKCTPECGLPTPKGHPLVIGGTFVKTGDFPWHAGIYKDGKQICGGSIINAKMVLSAAHCFYPSGGNAPYDKKLFGVAVGKLYRSWKDKRDAFAQTSSIDELIIPPTYDDAIGNFAQDIAILILQHYIVFSSYVRPICLQWTFRGLEEELKPNTPGIVSGWGLTSEGGEASEELKSITLPSVPRHQCRENFPADFRPYLTPGKFCAGYQNGSSVCQGDSGGGLCFPETVENNTVYFLRGVVSVGPTKEGTCDANQYTVFTSVLANLEWLKTHRAHQSV